MLVFCVSMPFLGGLLFFPSFFSVYVWFFNLLECLLSFIQFWVNTLLQVVRAECPFYIANMLSQP